MFATFVPQSSITFLSKIAFDMNVASLYGLKKKIEFVKNTRNLGKKDMKLNDATPTMRVDPESYEVVADEIPCQCEPSAELPLTQGYFLF